MPLYIKDGETTQLVTELARPPEMTKRETVKTAVQAELRHGVPEPTFMQKLQKLWAEHPVPPPTGLAADKAFFDGLSADL